MGMFSRKRADLQPWLDYFGMLGTYERSGFLEVTPEGGEAYITLPALLSLSATGGAADVTSPETIRAMAATARRIRAYAGWRSHREGCLQRPFSLHVVRDGRPHDLLFTMVISRRRAWWRLWLPAERTDVIGYG